jgi:diguanylate cyclase (GGDEF)-like protein
MMTILTDLLTSARAMGAAGDLPGLLEELRSALLRVTGAEHVSVSLGEAEAPSEPAGGSRLAASLAVPEGATLSLRADSTRPGAFTEAHETALALLAAHAVALVRAAQLLEETRRLALTDPLTGLANRRHFLSVFEDNLRRARRYQESLAVAVIDVDNLQEVNDGHGQPAGDRALQEVGAAMKEWMRQTDQLARLGGDEFAALLFQADRTTARQVVDRIRATVAELRLAGGGEAPLTLSVGIALFPSDGGDAEWLLVRAEQALGEAKRRGGNRVMLAEDVPRSAGGDEQTN